jgi:predicted Zn-dependent peptidase
VLIENHSAPVIASSVIVRAGLRDEEADIIGASHFLEHLLFNGTSHRTQEEIYQEFDQLGGYNNAHTGENFANFVILMNKENFERGLEIQCDMLFNSTLPDLNFEKERGIVKEEIGQSQDKVSYQADIYFFQRFFQGTPYSFPVLGNEQSIENLQRSRVMEYYRSHYFPNNMLAIITGDFDLQQIKGLVDKYLGAPSAGKLPEREEFKLSLPGQPGLAPISYHYEKSDKVYLRIGVPAPSRFDNEYYTAEILGKLLEKRLQQSLTAGEKPSVQELSLEYFSERDFGAYILRASFKEQDKAAAVAEAFRQTFQDFQKSPVNINHLKNLIISEKTQSLLDSERPHFFAMMKAPLLAFHGYEFVLKYYEKLQSVSPEALKTLAGKVYNEGQFIPVVVKPYPVQVKTDSTGACAGVIHESLLNGLELIISPGSGSGVFAVHFLFKNRSASEP